MSQRTSTQRRAWKERAISLLLAAAIVVGLTPGLTLPVSAAHWADPYLDQLVDEGILRTDQTADPDAAITRAEFMAIVNRAYGYTETGPIPFEDVLPTDWFYDDVSIAYTAGYMAGTSETTASPNDVLTREQAFCILGRNMMMKETLGESLAFADSRDVSDWARGTIKTIVDNYIVSGYPDNTLHPLDSISKGQMAVLVTQCLGVPINESGTYELGGVFGNVTITAPNVTLRNTVISGDLYISGGVGLGGIKLENVDVLGRIIVSSTGESEGGDASVILRNVTANEMLVDNMRNKTVTLRADGITDIAQTIVRTNAYLEDNNTDDKGLMRIELSGAPGLRLTLAGRIKEVVDKTPGSFIQLAKGTLAKLTIDEAAPNSTVQIDRNTKANEVNLDVATNVLGDGDIGRLNVNAPGSVVSMLPDDIYVRPGLNATIAGVVMDYQSAQEGSLDPRLLSGYPAAKDIAPTSFRADFAGNKKGTVYWAVSYVSDGSIGEDDLISPPSYGNKAIVNGSVAAPAGGDEVSAQVSNLVVGGSYYLSAVLVDDSKERSPVKVISFSTPDNTVPAFAQGYPYMSRITRSLAQVTVMPTKSCKLYYALLPQGAQAPTANELKAAAVTGNLGYGVRDVTKNTEDVFQVNGPELEELKNYVLYLWLTDVDGANSSNVISLSFRTPDETPPEFSPEAGLSGNPGLTNVPLVVGLNEPGTVYWVAVLRGAVYPLPNNQNDNDNVADAAGVRSADLTKDFAKLQVKNGRNGVKAGSVRITNPNTDTAMNITGLALETAYDLYYVAVDDAGNYSKTVKKLTINTLDERPPTVRQTFSKYSGDESRDPLVSTDIKLDFSEDFRSAVGSGEGILDIWAKVGSSDEVVAGQAREALYELLSNSIELYQMSTSTTPVKVTSVEYGEAPPATGSWINFYYATVSTQNGHVIVTLPATTGHQLSSGSTYYFQVQNITDNSDRYNAIVPNPIWYRDMGNSYLPTFTTVFAQVFLSIPTASTERPYIRSFNGVKTDTNGVGTDNREAEMDYIFRMIPDATETVDENNRYDLQLYTAATVAFDLYCRISYTDSSGTAPVTKYLETKEDAEKAGILAKLDDTYNDKATAAGKTAADDNHWFYLGNSGTLVQKTDPAAGLRGVSVMGNRNMGNVLGNEVNYPAVSSLKEDYIYDFVMTITSQDGDPERGVWTGDVNFEAHVLAGSNDVLKTFASDVYEQRRDGKDFLGKPLTQGGLVSIGQTDIGKYLPLPKTFIDSRVPRFFPGSPKITPGDSFADAKVALDRGGTLYYVAVPAGDLTTVGVLDLVGDAESLPSGATDRSGSYDATSLWSLLPTEGQNLLGGDGVEEYYQYVETVGEKKVAYDITVNPPNPYTIMAQPPTFSKWPHGHVDFDNSGASEDIQMRGLMAETEYIVYFVLKGVADDPSPVFAYAFKTTKSSAPKIQLVNMANEGAVNISTNEGSAGVEADLRWIVLTYDEGNALLEDFENQYGKIKIPATFPPTGTGFYGKPGGEVYVIGNDISTTWLYALMTTYNHDTAGVAGDNEDYGASKDGYTLFDVFATPDQRSQLDNRLYYPNRVSGRTSAGSAVTRMDDYSDLARWRDLAVNKDDIDASQTYMILVSGHNAASKTDNWSTIDSFRAADDVTIRDTSKPMLKQTDRGVVLGEGVTDGYVNYASGVLSGGFYLNFDRALYWRESERSQRYPVVGGTDSKSSAGIGILSQVTSSGSSTILSTGRDGRRSLGGGSIGISGSRDSFYVDLQGITADYATMDFLNDGLYTSETGANTDAPLRITITRDTTETTNASGVTTITHRLKITVSFGSQTAVIENTKTETRNPAGTGTAPKYVGVTSAGGNHISGCNFTIQLKFDSTLAVLDNGTPKTVTDLSKYMSPQPSGYTVKGELQSDGQTYIIDVANWSVDDEDSITFLSGETICDVTGKATASGSMAIVIKVTANKTGGTAASPIANYTVTVTVGSSSAYTFTI